MNRVKKLLRYANKYVRRADWRDFALLKLCLCAVGLLIGLSLPHQAKKPALIVASAVFAATYVPLMGKFLEVVFNKSIIKR